MPVTSPEAIARKNAKRRAARAALKVVLPLPIGVSKTHPKYRRCLPALPEMLLKSDLRAFLAQAFRNTVSS